MSLPEKRTQSEMHRGKCHEQNRTIKSAELSNKSNRMVSFCFFLPGYEVLESVLRKKRIDIPIKCWPTYQYIYIPYSIQDRLIRLYGTNDGSARFHSRCRQQLQSGTLQSGRFSTVFGIARLGRIAQWAAHQTYMIPPCWQFVGKKIEWTFTEMFGILNVFPMKEKGYFSKLRTTWR